MSMPNIPQDPPELSHGTTANRWTRMAVLAMIVAGPSLIALVAAAWLFVPGTTMRRVAMLTFLIIAQVSALALLICAVGLAFAIRREKSLGYTTLFDAKRKALWQLDPRDGTVVHRPGEPR